MKVDGCFLGGFSNPAKVESGSSLDVFVVGCQCLEEWEVNSLISLYDTAR